MTLRQIWLRKSSRKLQLIYVGETLTDCTDEKLARWNDSECSLDSRDAYRYQQDDEVSIEVFRPDGKDASRIPRDISWLSSTSELHHQCDRMRMRTRNRVAVQHRHRYCCVNKKKKNARIISLQPRVEQKIAKEINVFAIIGNTRNPQARQRTTKDKVGAAIESEENCS